MQDDPCRPREVLREDHGGSVVRGMAVVLGDWNPEPGGDHIRIAPPSRSDRLRNRTTFGQRHRHQGVALSLGNAGVLRILAQQSSSQRDVVVHAHSPRAP